MNPPTKLNTVEFVQAGGTTIDLRKLDINWTVQSAINYSVYYPIALDLDGDGLDLSSVSDSNIVVKTASGALSTIGWVGPTDAFLAYDRDGSGSINRLSEIGFAQDKPGATSDLEGLKTWDTNGDGLLDKTDTNFSKLLIWQDLNQNGRSTGKELKTLEQAGIAAIDLNGQSTGYTADLTIESFVQNTFSFIKSDGTRIDAYDVSLARRLLGSEGLYAGEYQAEWGNLNEDGVLGSLKNDPKSAAKVLRVKQKKALVDKLGATYQEVKAQAQTDFSDNDTVDAKVMSRWAKKSKSEIAAWLSGQATEVDDRIKRVSSERSRSAMDVTAANATNSLQQAGESQAQGGLTGGFVGQAVTASPQAATSSGASSSGSTGGLGLSVTASQPLDTLATVTTASLLSHPEAWWMSTSATDTNGISGSVLGSSNGSQSIGFGGQGASSNADQMTQQQLLLLQAMASFGASSGGSSKNAAVWSHDASTYQAQAAASAGVTQQAILLNG